jgi:UDP-3-O-[3-hydroxymyristoyl] glucosamine N-acyltransferase
MLRTSSLTFGLLLVLPTAALAVDSDLDGVDDLLDNCISVANPLQEDTGGVGFGDACVHPTATVGAVTVFAPEYVAAGAVIEAGAEIGSGAIVGRNAFVGAGATVGQDTVVARGARLEAGSTLGANGALGYASTISGGSQAGSTVVVGALVTVRDGSTLGNGVVVARNGVIAGATLGANTVVGPGARVELGASTGTSVRLRKRSTIHRFATLQDGVSVGRDARVGTSATLETQVRMSPGTRVHANVTVASGERIGRDEVLGTQSIRPITIDGNPVDFGNPLCGGLDGRIYASVDDTHIHIAVTDISMDGSLGRSGGGPFISVVFRNTDTLNTSGTYFAYEFGLGDDTWDYAVTFSRSNDIYYCPNNGSGCQDVNWWSNYAGFSGNQVSELSIPRNYIGATGVGSGTVDIGVFVHTKPTANDHQVFAVCGAGNPQGDSWSDFAKADWTEWTSLSYPTYLD